MFLGLTVVGAVLSPAVLALGAAAYMTALLPSLSIPAIAAGLIAVATFLGVLNIRANAWLTGAFLGIELVALSVLAYLGFSQPVRTLSELLSNPMTVGEGHLQTSAWSMIGVATALSIFAYNGYGGAVYFGEEMRNARKSVARTVLFSLGVGVVTQLIPVTAVLMGAPDLMALISSDMPFNDFVQARAGPVLNAVMSAGVALALVNAVIVLTLSNARLFFSTGRDRVWPSAVNGAITAVHPRFRSPWGATIIAGCMAIVPCSADIKVLLIFTGTSLVVIYGGICLAAIIGRRHGATHRGGYRMPMYPVAPLFCMGALAYVGYTNWMDPDIGRPSLLVNFAVMAAAALYYWYIVTRHGPWELTGPVDD